MRTSQAGRKLVWTPTNISLYFIRILFLFLFSISTFALYWVFQEKGTLSYLWALGIDRYTPLNECTLQVPFI